MKRRILVPLLAALAVLAAGVVAGCGGDSSDASGSEGESGELTLVAYSTPEAAHGDIIPAFNETSEGEGIGFEQSYGSSGEQSRAVEQGLAADVVHLSLEPDVTSLVEAGLVDEDWNQDKTKGMVSNSVVVFMTRPGNPEDIQGWDDLTQRGHRGHRAQPDHLRRRALEHHGRLRPGARAGRQRGGGRPVPPRPLREHHRAGHQRA